MFTRHCAYAIQKKSKWAYGCTEPESGGIVSDTPTPLYSQCDLMVTYLSQWVSVLWSPFFTIMIPCIARSNLHIHKRRRGPRKEAYHAMLRYRLDLISSWNLLDQTCKSFVRWLSKSDHTTWGMYLNQITVHCSRVSKWQCDHRCSRDLLFHQKFVNIITLQYWLPAQMQGTHLKQYNDCLVQHS